jgi:maltose alpha-D-glucosyltransferase/alpha-amylase
MHVALASPSDNPDFAPQLATEEDVAHWKKEARDQLEQAYNVLRATSEWTNPDEARRVALLLEQYDQVMEKMDALAAQGTGTLRIRVHGDFHLGQVLVSQGDVFIVDFEGEPIKAVESRRNKSSPMRDVAGLLRSYDYAAAVAGRSGPADLNEAAELRKHQVIQRFAPTSKAAFLNAYREVVDGTGRKSSERAEQALLQMFVVEKAAYEICYEAANRPSWLAVPVNGLAKIVDELLNPLQGNLPNV